MSRTKELVATFALILLVLALPGRSVSAEPYDFKHLVCPFENVWRTIPSGINSYAKVTGTYLDVTNVQGQTPIWRGFTYEAGSYKQIDYPYPFGGTSPSGIDDSGRLVGAYVDQNGDTHGFLYSGGVFKTIDYPGSGATAVLGINNNGDLTGWFIDPDSFKERGFVYRGGKFTSIDYPDANGTAGCGINKSGQVVGTYYDSEDNSHGFLYSGGAFTLIEYPGATETDANGIDDEGRVVGTWMDAAYIAHGFLLSKGKFTTIDYPGAANTYAKGINNAGQIVGEWDNEDDVDDGFIATPSRSISGTVKNRKGIPVEEVTITLSGASSDETKTAFDGTYTFSNVKSGTYTITPSKDKYTFKPKTIKATVKDEDLEGQDFTLQTFTISGVVKNKKGEPADGISMNLGGDSTDTTQTASDGTYSFTDLMNGKYTITPLPTTEWYYFKPISKNVTVHENDVKNQNFTGKSPCQISGRIIAGTTPVQGVTVALTGKSNDQVLTDADGSYQFGGLQEGSYVVTPSMTGYVFKATSRKVKITDSDIEDVNFSASALHSLSGAVTSGGSPLPDVTMSLTGKAKAATTTAVDGSYSFPNLQDGAYTVTPTMSGHKFTPPKQAVKMTGSDVTGVDFTGSP